jgi:integrase/recombinase XerC
MKVLSNVGSFLNYLTMERRYSAHTLLAYEEDLQQFIVFSELKTEADLRDVNHQLVRAWVVELVESGFSNRTVSRKLSSLRSYFKWLKAEGVVEVNPMSRVRGPKVEKRLPQFIKESEFSAERIDPLFRDDFDGVRDRLMVELFYQTGIRLSELLGLEERNIHPDHIKVLGKRNKERIIPISRDLFELVNKYRSGKPKSPDSQILLFVKRDGKKCSAKFAYRKINNYLGSVTTQQKKSPHVLRHTFATHMLNRGAGLETLKDLMGHASLSATQVYTHNSFAQINSIYSQAHPRGRKT